MINEALIRGLAEEKMEGTHLFLLDVIVRSGNRILVTIDGDQGVTIDDCVMISRHIEGNLDREQEDFELQVSTGGADHPLLFARQYPKHVGRTLNITKKDNTTVKGILKSVTADHLEIQILTEKINKKSIKQVASDSIELPFNEIKESVILLAFTS
jgi:ribosome maturation factor RimP